jgi:hypothetical protein
VRAGRGIGGRAQKRFQGLAKGTRKPKRDIGGYGGTARRTLDAFGCAAHRIGEACPRAKESARMLERSSDPSLLLVA